MSLEWDYTALAASYSRRPNYADAAIEVLVQVSGLLPGDPVVDMGAGTGHLTLKLAERGLRVTAVEPNASMRAIGRSRTAELANICWLDALMEDTGLAEASFGLATYGSSFGVAAYDATLREAHRLLRRGGKIAVLFNHRDLDDPLQHEIEVCIRREVPGYEYGNRRADQAALISASGLFAPGMRLETPFLHEQPVAEWLEAWSSHATLARQAGDRFPAVLAAIERLVAKRCGSTVRVPYITRLWIGERI